MNKIDNPLILSRVSRIYAVGLLFAALSSGVSAETFYRVKTGDTLNSISNQYNVSVQQLVEMNNLANANDIKVGDLINVKDVNARNYKGQTIQYIVQPGDSFSSIAKKFKTSVSTIAEINNFPDDKTLFVSEKIYVPFNVVTTTSTPATTTVKPNITITNVTTPSTVATPATQSRATAYYIVKPGDTLIGVADKLNVYTATLAKLNNLETNSRLTVGQKLIVPTFADLSQLSTAQKTVSEVKTVTVDKPATTNVVSKPTTTKTVTTISTVSTALPKVNIVSYTVKPGDSLGALARRYNTTNADLARMNDIGAMDQLRIGQKILVPVQTSTSVNAKTATEKY